MLPSPGSLVDSIKSVKISTENPKDSTRAFIMALHHHLNKANGRGLHGNNHFFFPTLSLRIEFMLAEVTFPKFATPEVFIKVMTDSFNDGYLMNVVGDSTGLPRKWHNTFGQVFNRGANAAAAIPILNQLHDLSPSSNTNQTIWDFSSIITEAAKAVTVSAMGLSLSNPETGTPVSLTYFGTLY